MNVRTFTAKDFPALFDFKYAPSEIYVQGSDRGLENLPRLPDRGLAIVGTRYPQERCLDLMTQSLRHLPEKDLVIISGFAKGIDAKAHTEALTHGIATIAVLGCGLDFTYPEEHKELRKQILEANGLFISEFPLGTEPIRNNFLRRNRLIAAWSRATWVVQAPQRSGALNTAKWARDYDRYVLATPNFPGDAALAGNQDLIDHHAALPFWGFHSLSVAWLEYSGVGFKKTPRQTEFTFSNKRLAPIAQQVSFEKGCTDFEEIYSRGLAKGLSHEEIFMRLRQLSSKN